MKFYLCWIHCKPNCMKISLIPFPHYSRFSHKSGRNVITPFDTGGRNVITPFDTGGRNVITPFDTGGRNVITPFDTGGRNVN